MTPKISIITPSIRPKGLEIVNKALKRQTFTDFEWLTDTSGEKNEGDYWGVYKAYNRLVKRAKGSLIVTWQDYTSASPQCLEKFNFYYDPKLIVGAVGNKYTDDTWTVETWRDPRTKDGDCPYNEIELNLSAFPKQAFYDVGGFDEDLDKYSSLCGLDVLFRLNQQGYKFRLDQTNKSFSLEHGRLPLWDEKTPFNGVWQDKMKSYLDNPKLNYLH
jgi:hypothetical protein